jgi:hypothetical protein
MPQGNVGLIERTGACPRCGKTAAASVPLPGTATGRQLAEPEILVLDN